MRPKTIIMLILAIVLAIMLFQISHATNTAGTFAGLPEKDMIFAVVAIAFVLGYMIGRPRKRTALGNFHNDNAYNSHPDTLSDEDREYIN